MFTAIESRWLAIVMRTRKSAPAGARCSDPSVIESAVALASAFRLRIQQSHGVRQSSDKDAQEMNLLIYRMSKEALRVVLSLGTGRRDVNRGTARFNHFGF
jgi:hypothetical protein